MLALVAVGVVGCGGSMPAMPKAGPQGAPPPPGIGAGTTPSASAEPPGPVREARVGRPAKSTRIRFVPDKLILAGGAHAAVLPAQTVDGELKVPEDVRHLGWWDGSSYAGDPFGSTVIAGHVDSATDGLGFFARLLHVRVGATVTLTGSEHHASYRITSVRTVTKQALASDSDAFDQLGRHRLVLITCTGNYRRDRGGYDSNLVVIAQPIGLAR